MKPESAKVLLTRLSAWRQWARSVLVTNYDPSVSDLDLRAALERKMKHSILVERAARQLLADLDLPDRKPEAARALRKLLDRSLR